MIKSLLLKDYYILNQNNYLKKSLIIGFIISLIFSYLVGKYGIIILAVINTSLIFRVYENEEKNKTMARIKSMPIEVKDIVLEKFSLSTILVLISYIGAIIILGILKILGKNVLAEDFLSMGLAYFVIYTLYILYTPIIYKFSTRIISIFVVVITFIVVLMESIIYIPAGQVNLSNGEVAFIIMAISVSIIICSYLLSKKIIKNRDF